MWGKKKSESTESERPASPKKTLQSEIVESPGIGRLQQGNRFTNDSRAKEQIKPSADFHFESQLA